MYRKTHLLWLGNNALAEIKSEIESDCIVIKQVDSINDFRAALDIENEPEIIVDLIVVNEEWVEAWHQEFISKGISQFSQTSSLIIAEQPDIELEEFCYIHGAKEVIHGARKLVLKARLEDHLNNITGKHQASQQVQEASQMALLAMTNASDLGNMIKFTEDAIVATKFDELATVIMEFVSPFCEFALLEILVDDKMRYFGTDGNIDPDLKKILTHSDKKERIIRHDDLVELNATGVALVLCGLPIDDPEKFGRILDSLATFITLSERFVEMIGHLEIINRHERAQKLFLSVIGHELRTPLNSINGFTGLLSKKLEATKDSSKELDLCQRIQLNSWKMSNLIDISLDIERLSEIKDTSKELSTLNLDTMFEQLVTYFDIYIKHQTLSIKVNNTVNKPLQVDEHRLKRLVRSLIINALDNMQEGIIEVDAAIVEEEGKLILDIAVTDKGKTLTPAQIKRFTQNVSFLRAHKENTDSRVAIGYFYLNQVCKKYNGTLNIRPLIDAKTGEEQGNVISIRFQVSH